MQNSYAESARRYMEAVAAIVASMPRRPAYYIETFGCQQNEADSERLAGMTEAMGFVRAASPDGASLVIYNTCAVREHAEKKALSLIGRAKHLKEANPEVLVGVCGCMTAQPHRMEEIKKHYPYVDFLFGTKSPERYPEILYNALTSKKRVFYPDEYDNVETPSEDLPVKRETTWKAWLPIMYGCNNFCTYCIVPYVRGRERSRRPEAILAEARELVETGCKDITLLGQNVNSYEYGFAKLLYELDKIPGDYVIRFMTSHPKDATHELIDVIASSEHVARHFHLPMQAGSNKILAAMNRRYTREHYLSLVEYMRKKIPDIALSSDIIVGFPGETEEDFAETLDAVEKAQFDFIYSFIYSPRKGTPAAELEDTTPHEVKTERFARLLEVQNAISIAKNSRFIGQRVRLLVEGPSKTNPEVYSGRSKHAKLVHFTGGYEALTGNFAWVEITGADVYTLTGKLAAD
ncbi:MAG TPA: tRNA (N6-isopentenyl adenosine(37)-C2)-methylthiotransferase MiaB [Bacillota bacterium]|nr:tRNA (N6-isopentenyl adenosine(37)-C2)-methylthiotransferase MiaB [Bacillota bacterium]